MGDTSIQIKNLEYKRNQLLTKEYKNALKNEVQIIRDYEVFNNLQKELLSFKETFDRKLSRSSTHSNKNAKSCDFTNVKLRSYSKRIKALNKERSMIRVKISKINEIEAVKHQLSKINKEIRNLNNKLNTQAYECRSSSKGTTVKNLESAFGIDDTEIKEELKLSIVENSLRSRERRNKKPLSDKYVHYLSHDGQYPVVIPKLKFNKVINQFNSKNFTVNILETV